MPTAAWLRQRLAGPRQLKAVEEDAVPQDLTLAAVLVPIVERPEGLTVLLTQRTAHLNDHAGQVSFPGGRCELTDASPVFTALRETEEEIGLDPTTIEVLGILPEYRTGTGFSVTPVVGLVRPPFDLNPDSFEVAEVFETPWDFLMDAANHRRDFYDMDEGLRRWFWAMPWGERYIWGVTAGILKALHVRLYGDEAVPEAAADEDAA